MYSKTYKAKILLFGEYTIINGSHALAMPNSQYYGNWAFSTDKQANDLQSNLVAFADYLDELNVNGDLLSDLNLLKFKQQLQKGLYFKSNIPFGYGAGSSGALCAAVYDRFSRTEKTEPADNNLYNLRRKLAQIESYFHGSSSGVDPLVSFLDKPILIQPNHQQIVQLPKPSNLNAAVFLLDTGIERKTEPLVQLFLKKREDGSFVKVCNQLAYFNEKAIEHFLNAQSKELLKIVHEISWLQLEYFNEMIPNDFKTIWEMGLEGNLFKLKLCGAGGGGFILGFTEDFEQTLSTLSNESLTSIFKF